MTLYAIRPDSETGLLEDAEVVFESKYGFQFLEQAIMLWRLVDGARADKIEAIQHRLALAAGELGNILFLGAEDWSRQGAIFDWLRGVRVFVSLEVLAKHSHLIGEFVRACLDWHSSTMKPEWKQSSLSQHARKACCEFHLAGREDVARMEGPVHVRICHGSEEFRMPRMNLGDWC